MTDLLDILNEVVENDEVENENQFEELPPEENEYEDGQDTEQESTDSNTGFETGVSNSIGRGAVENIIKNTVYEKYNIDLLWDRVLCIAVPVCAGGHIRSFHLPPCFRYNFIS